MKGLYLQSKESKAPIMIYYVSESNEITRHIITVLSTTDKSIRAYCHMRKQKRVFKLDNILSCGPVRKRSAS